MKRQWKRTLSIVLSLAMIFSMTGMNTVFAVEGTPPGVSALCEHHPEHTAECGYTEGTPGTPCAHEHGNECYKEVTTCVHEHTDGCYDDAEETASGSNAKEPVNCEHFCDEESGCVTEKLDCRHEHDEDCGYTPAIPGTPCDFVCEECGNKDTGDQTPPPVEDAVIQTITGFPGFDPEGFMPLDTITVTEKTTVGEIGLPDTLAATLDGGDAAAEIPVEWETADGSDYEHTEYESYDFIPVWNGDDYELAAELTEGALPYITVRIAAVKNANAKDATALTELWVGSTQAVGGDNPVTSGEGWSYVDGVLTLNGATIDTVHGNTSVTEATIYADNDLTIELAGGVSTVNAKDAIYGILVSNNSSATLTITGSGSLVSGIPLYSDGVIIEDNPHVTIESGQDGPTFISEKQYAIINGGTLVLLKAHASIGQAMFSAPDLSGYPGVKVTASTDSSGTPSVEYNPANIASYRYLKIEPGDSPTVSEFTAVRKSAEIVSFSFIPGVDGTYVINLTIKGEDQPELVPLQQMTGGVKIGGNHTLPGAQASDVLVLYLLIGDKDGNKSESYSVEIPAYQSSDITTEAALIDALKGTSDAPIVLGADITLTEVVDIAAVHILVVPVDYTLTISGNGRINIGSHTLIVNGGGKVIVNNGDSGGFFSNSEGGALNLENITATLQSGYDLQVRTTIIDGGATVNVSTNSANVIYVGRSHTLNVEAGGCINIQNFGTTALVVSGTLNLNGGQITVGPGSGANRGITILDIGTLNMNGGALTGTTGGVVYLFQGAKVTGMNGKLNDRGTDFTKAEQVTVGAADASASADGLSEGRYIWDGSLFAKSDSDVNTIDISLLSNMDITQTNWSYNAASSWITVTGDVSVIGGTAQDPVEFSNQLENQLTFVIDSSATVDWNAHVKGSTSSTQESLLYISNGGSGGFTISGGSIANTGTGVALRNVSNGAVTVLDGAISTNTAGVAIYQYGGGGTVTVSGGTVTGTVSGLPIQNLTTGTVIVSGTAEVSSENEHAIENYGAGTVTVTGGTVKNTGTYNGAGIINTAGGDVTISGTANISSVNGRAIANLSSGSVEVSDAAVLAGGVHAIENQSTGTVTIMGGTVKYTGIYNGCAIWNQSTGTVTVSGGTLMAAKGNAIKNNAGTITVNGGVLFAYGNIASSYSDVIDGTFTAPTGDAVVIAWNEGAERTDYEQGSVVDLTFKPDDADVAWAVGGIAYSKGSNTGVLSVEEVTVTASPVTGSMNIGGTTVDDLAQNANGTGWTWTADTATLALDSNYSGAYIYITCDTGDSISLEYSGTVNMEGGNIHCTGALTIRGSGTLTVTSPSGSRIYAGSNLTFGGDGTVKATGYFDGLLSGGGMLVIRDDVSVEASSSNSSGISGQNEIVIDTTGTVTASTQRDDGLSAALYAGNKDTPQAVSIKNGTVSLSAPTGIDLILGNLSHTGGTINGNPPSSSTDITTEAELKTALKSTSSSSINVTENITLEGPGSLLVVAMGADHTLDITAGKTLTIGGGTSYDDAALINLNGHTLTVTDGKVLINNYGSNGIYGNSGTLNLENVEVEVTNSVYGGLGNIQRLNVKSGATITLNGNGDQLMRLNDGQTATVENGGTITVAKSYIHLYGGNLHINGGAVHVNSGSDVGIAMNSGATLKLSSGTLDGIGTIEPFTGCKVEGLGGIFTDRGTAFTASGEVTVGVSYASPNANGLTWGEYTWDAGSGTYSKPGYSVSGTVKDSGGNGISGAAVTLAYGEWETVYEAGTTTTDSNGAYTFSNISTSYRYNSEGVLIYLEDYRIKASGDGYAGTTGEEFSVPGKDVIGKDITLTADTTTYGITVTSGTASPNPAAAGATVTISANLPVSKKYFTGWNVLTSGVTLADNTSATTTFTMPAQSVQIEAQYTDLPADTYSITVQNDGNGAANANVNSAAQNTSITLTATPNSGYRFKQWQVISGGVTITGSTFTMPAGNVVIKAIFDEIPAVTYTITFNANGGTVSEATRVITQGATIGTLPTPTRTGSYHFDGWYTAASGGTEISAATVPTSNATYYAHWTDTSGGGGSGGGGSSSGGNGGSSYTPPVITEKPADQPNAPANAETTVETKVDATDKAAVNVPEKAVTDAVKTAQDAAKKAGTEKNGISITVNLQTDKAASSITAGLSKASVDALIAACVTEVKIQSSTVSVTLDLATLKAAQVAAGGAITVSAAKQDVSKLSAAAQAAIGNRPAFSFTLTSGGKPVTTFGGGTVNLAIPYTPQKGEDTGKLGIVYVDDNGGVTYLTDSSYNPNTKTMITRTGHFSVFGVGYKTDTPQFTDTATHWAKNDIDFVAARGLLSGTGNNQFSPNTSMTRGMFVTALGRLAGMNPDSYKTGKFTDVKEDAYYAPYVNWAADKGIVNGTSDTTFAPDQAVTRQEMAVIMANYAKAMGYTVPKTRAAATFTDNGSIASWAAEAVKSMQMAGVINGKDAGRFDPTGTAARAEVAATLHRYVELVIDPATAQGWTQNDVGQWLYYENGKPVTGWKLVDGKWYYLDTAGLMQAGGWKQIGGKWYYLYTDGSMAFSTKIDEFEVGADGARKES